LFRPSYQSYVDSSDHEVNVFGNNQYYTYQQQQQPQQNFNNQQSNLLTTMSSVISTDNSNNNNNNNNLMSQSDHIHQQQQHHQQQHHNHHQIQQQQQQQQISIQIQPQQQQQQQQIIYTYQDTSMDVDQNDLDGSNQGHNTSQAAPITVTWLIQNFEPAEGCSLRRSTLYNYYIHHCLEQKLEPVNPASFGKLIRGVFLGLRTRRLGTRGNSKYHYYGIRVKPESMLNQLAEDQASAVRNHPLSLSPSGSPLHHGPQSPNTNSTSSTSTSNSKTSKRQKTAANNNSNNNNNSFTQFDSTSTPIKATLSANLAINNSTPTTTTTTTSSLITPIHDYKPNLILNNSTGVENQQIPPNMITIISSGIKTSSPTTVAAKLNKSK
jgi:hypothetical protein